MFVAIERPTLIHGDDSRRIAPARYGEPHSRGIESDTAVLTARDVWFGDVFPVRPGLIGARQPAGSDSSRSVLGISG